MERRFVLFAHTVPPDGAIHLNDLAGSSGRMDVTARAVTSAFLLSHDVRRDTRMTIIVGSNNQGDRKLLRLDGSRLKMLNPDERSTGALLSKALARQDSGRVWLEASPGIEVRHASLEETLREATDGSVPVLLDETATTHAVDEASTWAREPSVTFLLSDHQDLTPTEREAIAAFEPRHVTLGATAYHGHACVAVVHWLLDEASRRPS